jgi:hypothetical protein
MKGFVLAVFAAVALAACSGEDRSDEMPRVPQVETLDAAVVGDSCTMCGRIIESHNSSLKECGFVYGREDSASDSRTVKADTVALFSASAAKLAAGAWWYAAYARNGMGTSYGDTLRFTVE